MKRKIKFILVLIIYSISVYSQNSKVIIEDLKPIIDENKFPLIKYDLDLKVEDKINTLLQLENLEHLPNIYKSHPFEKIVYGHEEYSNIVQFYGYAKNNSPENILTLMLNGEATGAYSEGFEIYYNFDLKTGKKINLNDLFTEHGLTIVTKKLNKNVRKNIKEFLETLKNVKNEGEDNFTNEQIELYSYCLEDIDENTIEYYDYYFEQNGITFTRGRCSNHAMRALDDLGRFKIFLAFDYLNEHLTDYGLNLLNGKSYHTVTQSPEGKFYKGSINNKYLVTVLLLKLYSDNSLNMQYWYDKIKIPIEWNGSFKNNHFSLIEYDKYDEEKGKWIIKAKIEADLINNRIIGTWTNVKTNEVYTLELMEH